VFSCTTGASTDDVHVFDGDDAFTIREELARLIEQIGDPATSELNTAYLDGHTITFAEVHNHCSTFPFLADRRLVIVTGLLERLDSRIAVMLTANSWPI